jgi:hypothetical protein
MIVRNGGEHPGFANPQRRKQGDILGRRPNPSGRLDGGAGAPALHGPIQHPPIGFPIYEKFSLTDRTGIPGKRAEFSVDSQALFRRQRKAALLAVAMGGLGHPNLRRQAGRSRDPVIAGKIIAGK